MRSCVYTCRVMHSRFAPKSHRFDYGIFMLAIDLDELGLLSRGIPLLSVNARNLYAFHESDYLPTGEARHNGVAGSRPSSSTRLKDRVIELLAENGIPFKGRVTLVTLPRVLGYTFNPVSFYFCTDEGGAPVAAIAEVTNTFREVKPYVLGPGCLSQTGARSFSLRVPKHFYVSPFSDVDVAFEFNLFVPEDSLVLRVDDYESGKRTLASALTGQRRELTASRLAWCTLRYPLVTLRTITLIHVHALILALKRVPWFRKAARAEDQRDLYRPHPSIASHPIR